MVLPGGQLLAALAGAILATELQKRRRNTLKAGMQKTIDDLMAKLAAEHEELEDVRGTSNMLTLVRAALESKVHQVGSLRDSTHTRDPNFGRDRSTPRAPTQGLWTDASSCAICRTKKLEAELDMAVFEASELMEDCGRLQTRYISKVEAMLRVLGQSTIEKATFQQIQALLISDEWTVVQDPNFDAVDGKEVSNATNVRRKTAPPRSALLTSPFRSPVFPWPLSLPEQLSRHLQGW